MNQFQVSMQPYPGLARWSRRVQLPKNGITLHLYDTRGSADTGGVGATSSPSDTPVLLLHGLGDEADTWRSLFPLINRRAIAPDLPGFGRSDPPNRGYSVPFFADTLLELLDALSLSRVILVGHSLGAAIAQTLALEHSERVEKLILIDGGLVAGQQRMNLGLLLFLIPGLGEWSYNRLRRDPQAAYRTLEPYYNRLEDLPPADRDFLYQRVNERVWSDVQRRAFLSTLRGLASWLPAQQKDLPRRLSGWKIPTLILWGENDRINPVETARALARLLPSARLTIIRGAGHNLQQEKPKVVAEAVS